MVDNTEAGSTLTPGDIVRRWGVSDSAVRRALRADRLVGAYQDEGVWRIPFEAAVSMFGPQPATPPQAKKEVDEMAAKLEAAEAQVAELKAAEAQAAELVAELREQVARLEGEAKGMALALETADKAAVIADRATEIAVAGRDQVARMTDRQTDALATLTALMARLDQRVIEAPATALRRRRGLFGRGEPTE